MLAITANFPDDEATTMLTVGTISHVVWAGLAGSGVSTALMEALATQLLSGACLSESVWVLLPQHALVGVWQQQWAALAKRKGIPSALGVRVLTLFEWQLHWLNQYFMLATPLVTHFANELGLPATITPTWSVAQSRWDTVGEASLLWLLKTYPLFSADDASSQLWQESTWQQLLAYCLHQTPLSETVQQYCSSVNLLALRTWFFSQTLAKGWLPKAWIAPLYTVLLAILNQTTPMAVAGMKQQVQLLVLDEVQQFPLEQLQPLLASVAQAVWLGLKTDPISLEVTTVEQPESATLAFTQTRPPILTALHQWGWAYTLMETTLTEEDSSLPIMPVATPIRAAVLAQLVPESSIEYLSAVTMPPLDIHRLGFEAEGPLNEWLKQHTATQAAAGYRVGVLVPSVALKRLFQTQLLGHYAPLESQWLRILTLCLTGWQLAMEATHLLTASTTVWEINSATQQPQVCSWVWVEFPALAEQLNTWQTAVTEAVLPFCTALQWQTVWHKTVQHTWQTTTLPSQWLTAWVRALSGLLVQQAPQVPWQRVYIPLLKELQMLEVQLGSVALMRCAVALTPWLDAFMAVHTMPMQYQQWQTAHRTTTVLQPVVLTYEEAVGHRFDVVICPDWMALPDVKETDLATAFDAPITSVQHTVTQQWLPKTVLNHVLGAWATAQQQLVLLEKTSDAVITPDAKPLSAKALFLQQHLLQPVLVEALQIPLQPIAPQGAVKVSAWLQEAVAAIPVEPLGLPHTQPVHEPEKPLYLSVSGLQEYLACPKRYYYSRVLKLPTASSPALLKGNLLHLIMEQFNLQATAQTHCVEHLLAIATHILQVEQHRYAPPTQAILDNEHYQAYVQLPRLARFQLQQTCLAGLANLEPQGYFCQPITHVQAELNLPEVELTGLPGVRFKMMLDAVLHHPDGTLTLVDYKAYGSNKYTAQAKTVDPQIREVLEPLPPLVNGEAGYDKTVLQHRHYQLPLYAYGLQDSSVTDAFTRLDKVGLQLIRPQAVADKLETGSRGLYVSAEDILTARSTVLESLQTAVVTPLRNDATFAPNPTGGHCEHCAFTAICPATATGEEAATED